MTQQELNTAKDKDLITSLAAMKRAAALARKQAVDTDTAIILQKQQKIVRLTAEEIRNEGKR
ncbi:MAG: hypothetical protein Q7S85_06790 [Rugosibacter sp.]|jgi:hypothetical protein|nr:hypothetical protein [Rugosibacter sp.]HQN47113.1 hypothetical protein [Rugosibacter sp.]